MQTPIHGIRVESMLTNNSGARNDGNPCLLAWTHSDSDSDFWNAVLLLTVPCIVILHTSILTGTLMDRPSLTFLLASTPLKLFTLTVSCMVIRIRMHGIVAC
ncbi:hypothetical protein EDB84DRAFT_554522 [Lactarius hengduanensis]|nr:hypothetical protein EDB84DRAFT_554522 [Lactarius hengduanensis]